MVHRQDGADCHPKAGSAVLGQSMVKIVSKHHRVLDAANELMWTWLAVEAPGSSSGYTHGDVPIPAAHPGPLPV